MRRWAKAGRRRGRLLALAIGGAGCAAGGAAEYGAVLKQVIDGDTVIAILDGAAKAEVVRLLGVDAPEELRADRPNFAWAEAARRGLVELGQGKRVRLVTQASPERDRYGRMLAYVHLAADGTDLNAAMISRGRALHYTLYPHPRSAGYAALQAAAQAGRRGVHAAAARAPAGGDADATPARPRVDPGGLGFLVPGRRGGYFAP